MATTTEFDSKNSAVLEQPPPSPAPEISRQQVDYKHQEQAAAKEMQDEGAQIAALKERIALYEQQEKVRPCPKCHRCEANEADWTAINAPEISLRPWSWRRP